MGDFQVCVFVCGLFPCTYKDYEGRLDKSFLTCAFFFSKMELSLCTLIPLSFRPGVRQKCLNELRHTYDWMRVPWWVVCELISVMGFHTMPGQHSHATLTASHWLLIINTYTKSMVLRTLFVSFQGWLITVIPRKQTKTTGLCHPLRTGRKKRARLRDFWKNKQKEQDCDPWRTGRKARLWDP